MVVRILVVDDEESLRHMLSLSLSKAGYGVWTAADGAQALEILGAREPFELCLTDVRMPGMDGLSLIEEAVTTLQTPPTFLAMSAYGDESLALEALRRGAFDYVSKPFELSDLLIKLRLIIERRSLAAPDAPEARSPAPKRKRLPGLSEVIADSAAMQSVFQVVRKVRDFPTTVLLTGETGTGKERIAVALHAESVRSREPFIPVNCAAIPETLLESELFGHVKGAFTDAAADRRGLFEVANGGTLFLDEVAELPTSLQVKLLRVLVEHEVRPVGASETRPVDVRLIAATSRDLPAMVASGAFREDLFYRLNVVAIDLPPLRERPEDIAVLARHFVNAVGARLGFAAPVIEPDALDALTRYRWPGNVRELENAVERALVLAEAPGTIRLADLDSRFDGGSDDEGEADGGDADLNLKRSVRRVEQNLITQALDRSGGNRLQAARLLGISERTLLYRLKEYGIS